MPVSITHEGTQEQLERSLERERALQLELDYHRRLFSVSNRYISPTDKLVMWAVRGYILRRWHLDNAIGQEVEVRMGELAEDTGLCAATVGRSIKALHAAGLVERREFKERVKNGQTHTHVFVALTMLSYYPETVRMDDGDKRNHGGERVCKFCGSKHLTKVTKIVCDDCHMQQEDEERIPVNGPDPDEIVTEPEPQEEPQPIAYETHERRTSIKEGKRHATHPPKPDVPCKFGHGKRWIWYSEENWYICAECYSPAPKAEISEEGRDITWTPF